MRSGSYGTKRLEVTVVIVMGERGRGSNVTIGLINYYLAHETDVFDAVDAI